MHLLILAVATAVVLGLGLQAETEDGRPPAYQSVLLVTGLLLLYATLLRLADVLGADFGLGGGGARDTPLWAVFPPGAADVDVARAGRGRRVGPAVDAAPLRGPRC